MNNLPPGVSERDIDDRIYTPEEWDTLEEWYDSSELKKSYDGMSLGELSDSDRGYVENEYEACLVDHASEEE